MQRLFNGKMSVEFFEERRLLAGIEYQPHILDGIPDLENAAAISLIDVDFDGNQDLASRAGVFRNSGAGEFIRFPSSVDNYLGAGDYDNDGDEDLIAVIDSALFWLTTTDGQSDFENPIRLPIETASGDILRIETIDLDGDGLQDLIPVFGGRYLYQDPINKGVVWFKNEDGAGSFSDEKTLAEGMDFNAAVDLDGDNLVDIVGQAVIDGSNTLVWMKNLGAEIFSQPITIATKEWLTAPARIGDIDRDGDIDILWGGRVSEDQPQTITPDFYLNDGSAQFAQQPNSSCRVNYRIDEFDFYGIDYHTDVLADINNDGALDLVFISIGKHLNIHERTTNVCSNDGGGGFQFRAEIDSESYDNAHLILQQAIFALEIDSSGETAIIVSDQRLDVNLPYDDDFVSVYHDVLGDVRKELLLPGFQWIYDIVEVDSSVSPSRIAVLNYVTRGQSRTLQISYPVDLTQGTIRFEHHQLPMLTPYALSTGDLNSDGWDDLILAGQELAWIEGTAGGFDYSTANIIDDTQTSDDMTVIDFDGDGDADIVSADFSKRNLFWHENTDARFQRHKILSCDGTLSHLAGDMDNDSDADLIVRCGGETSILQNIDDQTFKSQSISSFSALADIDGDGDVDAVGIRNGVLVWYEIEFAEVFKFTSHRVGDGFSGGAGDVDGDGDIDLYVHDGWYLNTDGRGNFGELQPAHISVGFLTLFFIDVDVDGDGDLDRINRQRYRTRVDWLENKLRDPTIPGDSNRDGVFDSSDLIQVFQVNEYEDAIDDNSTFEDGDWNGDGEFDSKDLVFAFQFGAYVSESLDRDHASLLIRCSCGIEYGDFKLKSPIAFDWSHLNLLAR